jgi:hypothetical protein
MIKLTRAVAVLLAFTLAAYAQSTAQDWNSAKTLAAGTEVRVRIQARTIRGQIQVVNDDALTVNSGKGQEMFARNDVLQVYVKKKGHRVRNALIGVGVGAGIGVGLALTVRGGCFCSLSNSEIRGVAIGGLMAIGAVIGAVVPTGGWREVYKK